jgi:hypothetical protein
MKPGIALGIVFNGLSQDHQLLARPEGVPSPKELN